MTSIVKPVLDPVFGERALAISPTLAPGGDAADFAEQSWGRRTRYFAGRSVTERALQIDQHYVASHLATTGQRMAPGVVVGLEVSVSGTRTDPVLHIAAGIGLCLSGEDVRVPYPIEIPASSLWVVSEVPGEEPQVLADLLSADPDAAHALIVQLRPIVAERTGEEDANDPCEVDAESAAFLDEQLVDGCRVRLAVFELPADLAAATAVLSSWRNELANAVFDQEGNAAGEPAWWQSGGLPVAMLGFPPAATEAPFADVHIVARRGGTLNAQAIGVERSGGDALWQARFEQFIAQVSALDVTQLVTDGLAPVFRWLPPVGLLPTGAVDVRADVGEPDFPLPAPPIFSDSYVIEVVPVELESLDDYLSASVSLAPFDSAGQEQVQLLVPVPQQHFDPDLLIVEDETPDEFRDAIERFLLILNHRLGRRTLLRSVARLIALNLQGDYPSEAREPRAVVGEVGGFFPTDSVLAATGLAVPPPETLLGEQVTPLVVELVRGMYNAVGGPSNGSSVNPLSSLLSFVERGTAPTSPSGLQQNTADETVLLFLERRFGGRGLVGFANVCLRQLVSASERITLAFERLQSELHRVREYVSGAAVANQLASSPIVSAIAVRDRTPQPPLQLRAFAVALRAATQAQVSPSNELTVTVPTAGIPTGGRPIASSILFNQNIITRLDSSPPAFDASANADRAAREALRTLLHIHDDLGLSLDGLVFPPRLFNRTRTNPPLVGNQPITIATVREEIRRWIEEGQWSHEFDSDPGGTPRSESDFFGNAVRRLEEMVAVLRIAEARLTAFEAAVDLLQSAAGQLQAQQAAMAVRLAQLQDEIDEIRHDVRVARALEREEMDRAVRVNQFRRQVIAEHVPFLVFRRPRTVEPLRIPPAVQVEAAFESNAVPDCLADDVVPPEQLTAMLGFIRELPVNRLTVGPSIVRAFDKQAPLLAVADHVSQSALVASMRDYHPFAGAAFSNRVGSALVGLYAAQRDALDALRMQRSQRLSLTSYRTFSWSRLQSFVQETATVGDVLRLVQGKQLANELGNIERVATCLYERFSSVPPIVRLAWVQLVSEEDEVVVRLHDLAMLPNWELVDRLLRRDLQAFVDWLMGRFDLAHGDAAAYVSDLVRVALLLSGHAPVRQVLDATVIAPRPVSTGSFVRAQLDVSRVRVGMHVTLYSDAARTLAAGSGVVDDLADGVASIRVVSTPAAASVVATHVLLSEPSQGPKVVLAGGKAVSIDVASMWS